MQRLRRMSFSKRDREKGASDSADAKRLSEREREAAAAAAAAAEAAEEAERLATEEAESARRAAEAAEAEAARIEREKTVGCYLTFSDAGQGSLSTVWSALPVEGALAFFKPQKPVPQHKFTANQGRSILVSDCGRLRSSTGQSSKQFFKGIGQFVKSAKNWDANIIFLAQLEGRPVSIFLNDANINVVPVVFGEGVDSPTLARMKAVAVFSEAAGTQHMSVLKLETNYFMTIAEKEGAGLMLAT
uniref:Immune mapped protein 2 N-terminal domain-containing protein n=1 Tax=Calcidiscus leptoporus TaxID=127549 RepID=A0A7S0NS19_9EUKA|mmetsp:Transcript_21752/g.50030  ORF Transcript_21752/g.50030 Transcript_21752/m.50030 type:complete len:245 (+) Transcript_21752:56-790(+)